MAKRTQAAKRHRQSLKRRARNYAYRSRLRTFIKKARLAVESDAENKEELLKRALRELDRMVTKGVIHKNNAARRKSRLMHLFNKKTLPTLEETKLSPQESQSLETT